MSHAEQIEALKGLLERVNGAKASDRDLDEAIHAVFRPDDSWWQAICEGRRLVAAGRPDEYVEHPSSRMRADSWASGAQVTAYTGSTDAALGLVKASGFIVCEVEANLSDRLKLPSEAHIRTWEADSCGAVGRGPTHHGRGATPALAVLSALLSAKLALLTQEAGDA